MAFDVWLYVALAGGIVVGRFLPHPTPWVYRATLATVAVLVGLLGASLTGVAGTALLLTIPLALGYALLVLGLTALAYLLLRRGSRRGDVESRPLEKPAERFPISLGFLAALLLGFLLGHVVPFGVAGAIPYALYLLLALVGFDLRWEWKALGELWAPITAAAVGAVVAAPVFTLVSGTALRVSLATSLAFGWYSLAGPLVADRAGAVFGLLAFLTNFLREDLTMLLAPLVGRRLRGGGLAALGGATAMDTTLFFVTRYGDREAASLALASGLILTLAASLLLPAVLSLPV